MGLTQDKMFNLWKTFVINSDSIDTGLIRPIILDSWKRCKDIGVDPYQKKARIVLSSKELEQLQRKNKELISTAMPIMENLYEFVKGTGFMVALADSNGYIIKLIGDDEVIKASSYGNFALGAKWSEDSAGTNGIGTALKYGKPFQIFSYEHYCICSHQWTCSAAPIHDEDGSLIGVLDMTGTYEKVHKHTLGMVVAGAAFIEKELVLKRAWKQCDIANQLHSAIMSSVSEGIIALDSSYNIISINEAASRILQINNTEPIGKNLKDIIKGKWLDWDLIFNGSNTVTDMETDIRISNNLVKVTVTTRPIVGSYKNSEGGTILVINEISRARKLVQNMMGSTAKITFADIIGEDKNFIHAKELAATVAKSDCAVLLLGESGSGKDVFAQAIHNASYRSNGPFLAINCGAIPRDLISSELFGYAEGAFTGAKRGGNPGKFELADGGTLFLDEIGDMPMELQTWLLRVLEHKTVTRVGSSNNICVDVRIITATNKDLAKEVQKGNFRKDLFYRINVFSIPIIPLRERKDDIELLFRFFINKFSKRMGKNITRIDDEVIETIRQYSWPGNVRELQNVVERMLLVIKGETISPQWLPPEIRCRDDEINMSLTAGSIHDYEKKLIKMLLDKHGGNLSQVAKEMAVARTTLYRKIEKYRIVK